jgi:hypothetical protein
VIGTARQQAVIINYSWRTSAQVVHTHEARLYRVTAPAGGPIVLRHNGPGVLLSPVLLKIGLPEYSKEQNGVWRREKESKDKGDETILGLAQSWYNALDVLWISSSCPLFVRAEI